MVAAISMVKDEADVVERSVRHMLGEVDHVLVADNGSTDGTREILEQLDCEVLDDPEPGYYQSLKMSRLAAEMGARGAEWIVPFDADEIWRGRNGRMAELLSGLPDWLLIAEAALYDHVATGEDDVGDPNPITRLRWRRAQCGALPKVACRFRPGLVIHQGNHGATYEDEPLPPIIKHLLSVRHFPYRSIEQFVSKARNGAAAYAATKLPEAEGGHWRGYGRILEEHGEAGIADVFHTWFYRERPGEEITIEGEQQPPLVLDPCPSR